MRTLLLAGTSLLALAVCIAAPVARAAYTVTLTQEGGNVVATGSGTIDTAGRSFALSGEVIAGINLSAGAIVTGPARAEQADFYNEVTGPASFGGEGTTSASSGSGDAVAVLRSTDATHQIALPVGYVSGSALADSSTYDNQTFSSLGVTPGTYVYRFGADTFTVQIGALALAPVPEPASLALFGTGLAGLGLTRRRWRE